MTDELDAAAVLETVRVAGASISTLGGILSPETVSATDPVIARVDELQFDFGEGPCWDALDSGVPVLEPDVRTAPRRTWPAFSAALKDAPVGALFAFPIRVGPFPLGAIDLYDVAARDLDATEVSQIEEFATETGRRVLRRALRLAGIEDGESVPPHARRVIHQATGFVIAQVGVSAEEAELLIRASAFAEGRSMREIAEEVVSRRRRFTARAGRIEESR